MRLERSEAILHDIGGTSLLPCLLWVIILSSSCVFGLSPFFSLDTYLTSIVDAFSAFPQSIHYWAALAGFMALALVLCGVLPRFSALLASWAFFAPLIHLHLAGIAHVQATSIWSAAFVVLSHLVLLLIAYSLGSISMRLPLLLILRFKRTGRNE